MESSTQDWCGEFLGDEIYYEITSACDLKCTHCYDVFRKGKSHIDAEQLLWFHGTFISENVRHVVITGGEPTLHPNFTKIVEGVSKEVLTTVTTNGVRWGFDNWVRMMNRCPKLLVQLSIDGASAETFDSIRGLGVHQHVDKLLRQLASEGLGSRLGMSMTVTKQNVAEVDDVIAYARQLGLGQAHFPQLLLLGNAAKNRSSLMLLPLEQIELEEKLLRLSTDLASEMRISVNRLDRALVAVETGMADCLRPCSLKINPSGAILPCPVSSDDEFMLGSIYDSSFAINRLLSRLEQVCEIVGEPSEDYTLSIRGEKSRRVQYRLCEACRLSGGGIPDSLGCASQVIEHHIRCAHTALSEVG